MGMNVAVCVPYRPVDPDRLANFERTSQQWALLGWPVYTGDSPGRFCRSHAINAAAAKAPDADVLLIADCDFLLADVQQACRAACLAFEDDCYVVAYSNMQVLDMPGTVAIRAGEIPAVTHVIESVGLIWGNCFAVTRVLFDRVGGFDERFIGWGAEDVAFLVSASTMGGPKKRVYGDAYHLGHPTNEDRDNLAANNALASRYRGADGDREAMLRILAER